jgi:hypothetical protein
VAVANFLVKCYEIEIIVISELTAWMCHIIKKKHFNEQVVKHKIGEGKGPLYDIVDTCGE